MSSYQSKSTWPSAIGWLALALFAQIELLAGAAIHGAELSTVLVTVVWFAVRVDLRSAALFGLIAGACEDIFSAQTGAAWTLSTTLTAAAASVLSRGFFADSVPLLAVLVLFCTLLRRLIFWVIMALQGYPAGYAGLHFHQALWEAALNAAFTVVAFTLLRFWRARRTA